MYNAKKKRKKKKKKKLTKTLVMAGLALCSATEASFKLEGFVFALATNLSEW